MSFETVLSRRRVVRAAACAAAAGFADAACAPVWGAEVSGRVPVNIVIIAGNNASALQAFIEQQGYLEEFGVAATVFAVSDGSKATGALLSGSADICTGSGVAQVLPAIEKGGALKIVAGTAVLPLTALYSARPEIKSAKDLVGRTVGVGAPGALLHQLVVALMNKKGLDYRKVDFVNVGSSSDLVKAISAGTVDAGVGDYELYAQQANFGIHSLSDGELWTELPEFVNQGAYVATSAITQKRDAIVRTLAAYAKAFLVLQNGNSLNAYLKARSTAVVGSSPAGSEAQWRFYQKYKPYLTTLTLSDDRLSYMQELNTLLGVQSKVLPSDRVADFSLARDAIKLLG